jgi:hypothetical protein
MTQMGLMPVGGALLHRRYSGPKDGCIFGSGWWVSPPKLKPRFVRCRASLCDPLHMDALRDRSRPNFRSTWHVGAEESLHRELHGLRLLPVSSGSLLVPG